MINEKSYNELKWVIFWAVVVIIASSIPYLWGVFITPPDYNFLGLTYNIDDGAVYLSWMRQAADGHLFIRNLFTSDPQTAGQFNLLFLAMGWFAAITHLPLIWVFHIFRVILGAALFVAVWQFAKLFLTQSKDRLILLPLIGLSAGLGWLIPGTKAPTGSVDVWQPEAITFLSLYLNPLFLAGLLLMIGSFFWFVMMERTGSVKYSIFVGLHLLLLGNIHTYDVITVAGVWAAYVAVLGIVQKRFPVRVFMLSVLAAAIAVPSVAYQYYLYSVDDVFRARANSPTPSPDILSFFTGYGLVLIGAVAALYLIYGKKKLPDCAQIVTNPLFILVWSVVGFVLPYIPVGQQRKLVMGLHIPLCILCAFAISRFAAGLSLPVRRVVLITGLLLIAGSNIQFVARDIVRLNNGTTAPMYMPYLSDAEIKAAEWLRENAKPGETVLAPPTLALFIPALTGHQVYYGHWSETPGYMSKIREWNEFYESRISDSIDISFLHNNGINYLVDYADDIIAPLPAEEGLSEVFNVGWVSVYRVE